jgi:hypothetical protein
VLRDPAHAKLKRSEIIRLADITPATYYAAFRDENFIASMESEMSAFRSENDFAVLHNLAEQARGTNNHNMIALYQRLQGRLREGGDKPAQIILVIGSGMIERPQFEGKKIIDVTPEAVKDADKS